MKAPDWRKRLDDLLSDWTHKQYAPGTVDCARFAQAWVEAVTGEVFDPIGPYDTVEEGYTKLQALGYVDHIAYARAKLKARFHWNEAVAGDLAVVDVEGGQALGGVYPPYIYVVGPRSLMIVDLAKAVTVLEVN